MMSATLLMASGCGLIFDDLPPCPEQRVRIDFNWDYAGNPSFYPPDGMTVLCYPVDGEDYWRYELPTEGGEVTLPYNSYNIVALNNDTRNINHINEQTYGGAMVYTQATTVTASLFREQNAAEPPHPDQVQPIRREADMMYVADHGDTIHHIQDEDLLLTLYPRQFTPNYQIIVDSVENLQALSTAAFALSGLSGAKYIADGQRIGTPVTFPGTLAVSGDRQLSGNVVTFGPTSVPHKNILCIYIWLRNGEKYVYMYDVTDQIDSSPDQMNLTVRVGGFTLPNIPDSGNNVGNLNVGIDNWITVDIELEN